MGASFSHSAWRNSCSPSLTDTWHTPTNKQFVRTRLSGAGKLGWIETHDTSVHHLASPPFRRLLCAAKHFNARYNTPPLFVRRRPLQSVPNRGNTVLAKDSSYCRAAERGTGPRDDEKRPRATESWQSHLVRRRIESLQRVRTNLIKKNREKTVKR